jgi:ribonuclease P/MRP protein subunit RPP40
VECYPKISPSFEVAMPLLQPPQEPRGEYRDEFCDFAVEIYEWLSMITLESPRVTINDQIDPFLSRYVPPSADSTDTEGELIMITWEGLMPASWVHKVFVEVLLTATPNTWLSLVVSSFADNLPTDSRDCMVLKLPGASNGYMMWEVEQ